MNIGEYNDGLPDSMAMASALFSEMGREERRELVKKRFNIDLDDNDLERLDEMSTLHEDAYEHGYADGNDNGLKRGIENGINQERKNSVDAMADIVMAFRNGGDSVEQSMSKVPIPANYRSDVEAEVRRRLS